MLRFVVLALVLVLSGCRMNVAPLLHDEGQQAAQSAKMEMDKMNQALLEAAAKGDKETIEKLLADGADIDATDERGRTSAMIAVHTKQLPVFNLLVEKGANINIRDSRSDNPLLYAGAEGMLDFVKASIAAGADTKITNRFGGTALIPAADRGHVDIVQELLAASDVNLDHVNNLGWTALLEAIILGDGGKNHQTIVKLLIEHGANVNLADGDGVSPLKHAQTRGYKEMAEALKAAGAK
ncbi:ankyrin repeat domain-containing protein [Paenibacillus contaminans]|uniref:Ankyrin repeat domain-containing protein n=1 Tax=Paenibacillus contaminans TaxID=450362 RepID=A0A329MR84_9BACL|nr:ankyrin repeat domain-containing protein [Paenibacillus contaminans]RAV21233.1 ankyrin repeat domain-containing protein [Paenibacillus contaminans]